jgi:hypothetical protein
VETIEVRMTPLFDFIRVEICEYCGVTWWFDADTVDAARKAAKREIRRRIREYRDAIRSIDAVGDVPCRQ